MHNYEVTYFYLATGMEGVADTRTYGVFKADDPMEAIELAVNLNHPGSSERDKHWIKGCLSARKLP